MKTRPYLTLLLLASIAAAACGDDVTEPPAGSEIPDVTGVYTFTNLNDDPQCTVTIPHPQILDGPSNSPGRWRVNQNETQIDIDILELDGRTLSAAEADSLSIAGVINATGVGPITRSIAFRVTTQDSTLYWVEQELSGTIAFQEGGATRTVDSNITFQSDYRLGTSSAPLLGSCTTTGSLTGQRTGS